MWSWSIFIYICAMSVHYVFIIRCHDIHRCHRTPCHTRLPNSPRPLFIELSLCLKPRQQQSRLFTARTRSCLRQSKVSAQAWRRLAESSMSCLIRVFSCRIAVVIPKAGKVIIRPRRKVSVQVGCNRCMLCLAIPPHGLCTYSISTRSID